MTRSTVFTPPVDSGLEERGVPSKGRNRESESLGMGGQAYKLAML